MISFEGNGTFAIGGIFNLRRKDATAQINPQIGIHFLEAFRFAIREINRNSSLMYGFKLQEKVHRKNLIVETGDGSATVKRVLFSFFAGRLAQASLAPYESYEAYKLSIVTNGIKYPLISSSATFDTTKEKDSLFFRVVPEDSFRVMAMIDLVKKLNWNLISVVSSNDRDGDTAARNFVKKIGVHRICFSSYTTLPEAARGSDYENAISNANAESDARGLVLFTTIQDSLGLIRAIRKLNKTQRFQIAAASGFTNYVEITRGNEDVLEGSLSLEHATTEIPDFSDYFLSLNLTNNYSHFNEFWEQTFQCSLQKAGGKRQCTGQERLTRGIGYYVNTPVYLVINAVYSLAYTFRKVIEKKCEGKHGYCTFATNGLPTFMSIMRQFLQANSFPDCSLNLTDPITNADPYMIRYDVINFVRSSSNFINRKVGNWSFRREGWDKTGKFYLQNSYNGTMELETKIVSWKGKSSFLTSSCRQQCPAGHVAKQRSDFRLERCCWTCKKCMENEITKRNTCEQCDRGSKPDRLRKECLKLATEYFRSSSKGVLLLNIYMGIASSGVMCACFVIFLFIRNNENRVVRASGRELCYFMLVGIILTFCVPFTFVLEPSPVVCSLQIVLPGIALCICYSPLFLKTNRIYRIFCNAQSSISRPQFISPKSQLLLLLFIICIQILLAVICIVSSSPQAQALYPTSDYVILHCDEDGTKMVLNLMLSVIFMVSCTWYAFKTRNFPKNYNESKYIGFTMYITCICWAVFLPTYFISKVDETYMRANLLCAIMISIGFLTLFGLFGQKVRLILSPRVVDENAPKPGASQASRVAADPNKYQIQIHKIDALAMCKEPSFIRSSSVVANKHAVHS